MPKTYVITIKSSDARKSSGGVAKDKTGKELSPKSNSLEKGEKYIKGKLAKVASVGFAMQAIDMPISYAINTIEARTGNSRLQELYSYQYNTAKSFVTATVAGAMAGGLIGAAIGFAGAAIKRGIDISIARQQLEIARSVESVGLQMAHIRAGTGGNRTGKEG